MPITAQPLAAAVAQMSAMTPIGSVLRSREWEDMPVALRETSQFSAGIESVRLLQTVQDRLTGALTLQREQLANGKTATFDRSSFINSIRQIARDEGLDRLVDLADRGGLKDITSIPRLGLIHDMQMARAQGFAGYKADQSAGALLLYPAQEFLRIEDRDKPRDDWEERWRIAGGEFFEGRMIALKTSEVWERLSRFGTPWPPFDFGSGMGIEDIDRDEAVALGVLGEDEEVEPREAKFNEDLQASAKNLRPEFRDILKTHFGPQIEVEGDVVKWQSDQGKNYEAQRASERETARSLFTRSQAALGSVGRGVSDADETVSSLSFTRHQAAVQGAAVAAGRKPLYHEQLLEPEQAEAIASALRASLPESVAVRTDGTHVFAWRPEVLRRPFPEIRRELEQGRGADMLGYGPTPMSAPGNVTVLIEDARGEVVAGFQTPADGARLFGKARTQDFVDATGQPHRYHIIEEGPR